MAKTPEKRNKIDDELTYRIIGCAMKVHNTLGSGFPEVIYQRCLAIELERQGLSFVREEEIPVYYEGIHVGTRRADFLVEGQVMVELKALLQLEDGAPCTGVELSDRLSDGQRTIDKFWWQKPGV